MKFWIIILCKFASFINLYKGLTVENRLEVVKVLGEWWDKEAIPDEELLARVVLIFKKENLAFLIPNSN